MFDLFIPISFKKLHPLSVAPKKTYNTDAGFDLTAVSTGVDEYGNYVYGTGISVAIPEGYVGLLFPRSSVCKKDLTMSNCVGVIDSPYRGEIFVKYAHIQKTLERILPNLFEIGDRVAQLVILKLPNVEMVEVSELDSTKRGSGGFGSSGA